MQPILIFPYMHKVSVPLGHSIFFSPKMLIVPLSLDTHLFLLTTCFLSGPEALRLVVESASSGASVLGLCEKGDAYIMAETGKVFKKEKEMKKGRTKKTLVNLVLFEGSPVHPHRGIFLMQSCRKCVSLHL